MSRPSYEQPRPLQAENATVFGSHVRPLTLCTMPIHSLSSAITAGSSLLLNAGTAIVLWSYHRSVETDGEEADGVLTFTSIAIAQACTIESVVAFVGLVGVLQVSLHPNLSGCEG